MMYGVSGSTKTSQCYQMVKYLHGTKKKPGPMYGKKWRMIHSDGGGYAPFVDSGMVEKGIVEVFDFSNRQFALADFRKLAQGYWPRVTSDGGEYFRKDDNCKTTDEQWEGIAGYIIEGMSSTGEVLKTHISNQREGVGFKESWSYEEDGEVLTGLQMGHYDLIQKEIYSQHMKGFNTLPVSWLIYTSLLGTGVDKSSKETVVGPQVCGNAATPKAPQWFMDCLHLDKQRWMDKDGTTQKEGMVAWFTQHLDSSNGMPCLCKCRLLPELYPELLKYFPYGFVPLQYEHGIDLYFRAINVITEKFKEKIG